MYVNKIKSYWREWEVKQAETPSDRRMLARDLMEYSIHQPNKQMARWGLWPLFFEFTFYLYSHTNIQLNPSISPTTNFIFFGKMRHMYIHFHLTCVLFFMNFSFAIQLYFRSLCAAHSHLWLSSWIQWNEQYLYSNVSYGCSASFTLILSAILPSAVHFTFIYHHFAFASAVFL